MTRDRHVLLALVLAFRLLDALALRTFFQPDEFFQALEPAWALAFGADSGAWLTWVRHRAAFCMRLTPKGMAPPAALFAASRPLRRRLPRRRRPRRDP
jgi:hypothetical protein